MAKDGECAGYVHINGHFDPMVLATIRSHSKADERTLEIFDRHHLLVGEGQEELKGVDLEAALVHMTSRHEQDHFARHASSELGLLVSLVLQLRSHARLTRAKAGDEKQRQIAEDIEFATTELARVIFLGERATEGNAVRLVNTVMSLFDRPAPLATRTPKRVACANGFGYLHFLEASAVLNEYGICEALKVPRAQWNDLLRTGARDEQLYFYIAQESLRVCRGVVPLAIMLVRKALDARVPVLGSPAQEPIDWSLFNPESRWLQMSRELEPALHSARFDELVKMGPEYLRTEDTMRMMLGAMEAFDEHFGWHGRSEPVLGHPVSLDAWRKRLSPSGAQALEMLFANTGSVLEHLCDSFREYRKLRVADPVASYSNFFLVAGDPAAGDAALADPPDRRVNLAAYPLFTVSDGHISSPYLKDKLEAVWTAIRCYVVSQCQAAEERLVPQESFEAEVLAFLKPDDPFYERLADLVKCYADGTLFRDAL